MAPASVYIGGLADEITRSELHDHLTIYGRVNALNMQKGFSFVEFDTETDATDFVATFSQQPFMGSTCKVELAKHPRRPRPSEVASTSDTSQQPPMRIRYPVVVQNLNPQTCWQELKDFGRSLGGTVAFCDIDKNHRRRGFLEYYTKHDADLVVQKLDGKELLGHQVTLLNYGRQVLREEHSSYQHGRSRSRSPVMTRNALPKDTRARRSRSPLEASRRHNTPGGSRSPRRRSQQRSYTSPQRVRPRDRDSGYTSRSESRRVHFDSKDDHRPAERTPGPSHSPVRRMTEFNEDAYVSDERKARIDRLAEEWSAYNHLPQPRV